MILNAAISRATFDTVRSTLVEAQVGVRFGVDDELVLVGLRDMSTTEAMATMQGIAPGYRGDLWIKVSELNNLGITLEDGDVIELNEDYSSTVVVATEDNLISIDENGVVTEDEAMVVVPPVAQVTYKTYRVKGRDKIGTQVLRVSLFDRYESD